MSQPSRRGVLLGATAITLTAGCAAADTATTSVTSVAGEASSAATSAADAATTLAKTTDIPVGGAKVFADAKVVVTQATEGDFKALTAVCTHRGCTVAAMTDGELTCPCHNSKFDYTGAVLNGPATQPLAAQPITVDGDTISLA